MTHVVVSLASFIAGCAFMYVVMLALSIRSAADVAANMDHGNQPDHEVGADAVT
ncbi:MAG: hypothetical protein AAGJ83_08070 [Planctomycetota bacterium]